MHNSQYVTNQFGAQIPVRDLLTNLRRMFAVKFFNSSQDEDHGDPWLQNPTLLKEKDELGHMSLVHNMFVKNFCIELHPL